MFLKRGKRPSVVSGFQRPRYCRQASKPTTKDIDDCCVLDLGKFPCVFQIIQYCFCPLTHVFPPHWHCHCRFVSWTGAVSVSLKIAAARTIWIADAHRGDEKRFVVRAEEKLTAFVELESQPSAQRDGFLGKGVFRVCGRM